MPDSLPPPPVQPTMTPAAGGFTYDQYVRAGWTDAQMIAAGLIQIPASAVDD